MDLAPFGIKLYKTSYTVMWRRRDDTIRMYWERETFGKVIFIYIGVGGYF